MEAKNVRRIPLARHRSIAQHAANTSGRAELAIVATVSDI